MNTRKKLPSSRKIAALPRKSSVVTGGAGFSALVERVVAIIKEARSRVIRTVNSEMVLSNWLIGREIVEYVQRGKIRAEYGEEAIEDLSQELLSRIGRGYSATNLRYFRLFYQQYKDRKPEIHKEPSGESRTPEFITSLVMNVPETDGSQSTTRLVTNSKRPSGPRIPHKVGAESDGAPRGFSNHLSWSHYRALLKVVDPLARAFYEIEAARENWSVPHLERQIHTQLHLRLLKSRNKDGVMALARKGQTVERPSDVIKSPLILDFLGLPDRHEYREGDLETAISASYLSSFSNWARALRSLRARSGSPSMTITCSSTSSSTTSCSSATC